MSLFGEKKVMQVLKRVPLNYFSLIGDVELVQITLRKMPLIIHCLVNKRDRETEEANLIERTSGSYKFKMHLYIYQADLFNETKINKGVP